MHRLYHRQLLFVLLLIAGAGSSYASAPAPTVSQAKYEIRFMEEMIDHHAMAVMMADACLERATHPELLEMCNNIKTSQTNEINEMSSWLASWYGISYSSQMTPGMMNQVDQLRSLTGAEFEIEFMKQMIRHHWKAVVRASRCTEEAYHAELIQTCESIVMTQTEEIRTMQGWLCNWYGICHYGPKANR